MTHGPSRGCLYTFVAILLFGHPLALCIGGVLSIVRRDGDVFDLYTAAYVAISLGATLHLSRLPQWRVFAWVCGTLFALALMGLLWPRAVV
jgi:hypothetical protein